MIIADRVATEPLVDVALARARYSASDSTSEPATKSEIFVIETYPVGSGEIEVTAPANVVK